MTPNFRVPRALTVLVMALAASASLAACKSLTRPGAQTENSTDTVTVYAFNGTPLEAPSGLWLFGMTAVPFTSGFNFDLAFDVSAQGQATLYTVRYVAGDLSGAHSVGIQKYNGSYDALDKAPTSNYVADSLYTVNVGDVFAIQTSDPNACGFSVYSNVLYAKVQVLGVDPGTRTVRTRFTVDPNCGFLSLVPSGIPKD
jgi:hypothetical protein